MIDLRYLLIVRSSLISAQLAGCTNWLELIGDLFIFGGGGSFYFLFLGNSEKSNFPVLATYIIKHLNIDSFQFVPFCPSHPIKELLGNIWRGLCLCSRFIGTTQGSLELSGIAKFRK